MARRLGRTGRQQAVKGRLHIATNAVGQAHVGRGHAIQHGTANSLRKLPLVAQDRARAIRTSDGIDARHPQRQAHRLDIGHRDLGRVEAQVPVRQGLQGQTTGAQTRLPPGLVSQLGQRPQACTLVVFGTLERGAAASPSLVDKHQVTPLAQALVARRQRAGQIHRALARAARKEEHRIVGLAPRHGRHHGIVDVDRHAHGLCRIERTAQHAATGSLGQAAQSAGGQHAWHGDRGGRRSRWCRCECRWRHLRAGMPRHHRAPGRQRQGSGAAHQAHASNWRSAPLSIRRCRSLAPPTNCPRTNTMGKVGQPVHIFNALRRRQSLR